MNYRLYPMARLAAEIDVEKMCMLLSTLLGGVKFKAVSSVLAKETKNGVGGWMRKASKTANATAATTSMLRRTLMLARFKVESERLRCEKMSQLESGVEQWQMRWEEVISGSGMNVVGVSGSFLGDNKCVSVVGSYRAEKSLHLSTGGDGKGIVVFGVNLSPEAFEVIGELLDMSMGQTKPEFKDMPTREDIDKSTVGEKYSWKPVEQGWLFDGRDYVNFSGAKCRLRPDIEEVVDLELQRREAMVKEYNESLQSLDKDMIGVMQHWNYIR